ncbi:hypothetical protein [Streptomyces sp. FH025]|uniref:hypothetical protein n=1 Tax=Streptomyces sp. FH025 TaxID=2815937 RepID=UPI001A9FF240|nr:hypothetical protein [Streptomyces sp. FH025]MBO1417780.1 hypothetical protein [Streptomyces sp. FH025]
MRRACRSAFWPIVAGLFLIAPLAGCTASGHPAAEAEGGSADRRIRDLMVAQAPLDEAADQIRDLADWGRKDGYGGVVVSPEERRLRLYWKGDLPDDVAGLVDRLRKSVDIDVRKSAHSQAELFAAVQRLEDAHLNGRSSGEVSVADLGSYRIVELGPSPDASSIWVSAEPFSGLQPPGRLDPAPLAASLREVAAVPVKVRMRVANPDAPALQVARPGAAPSVARAGTGDTCATPTWSGPDPAPTGPGCTRLNDGKPFSGGARWIHQGDEPIHDQGCTTAFGVHDQNNATYLLTAHHCVAGAETGPVTTFGRGDLGTIEADTPLAALLSPKQSDDPTQTKAGGNLPDLGLIAAPSGNRIYDGGYDTGTTKQVSKADHTNPGDYVCVSSSFSKTFCNIRVDRLAGHSPTTGFYVGQCQPGGKGCVAADVHASGSPVFSLDGGDPAHKVIAKGVVHRVGSDAALDGSSCPSSVPKGDNTENCAEEVHFSDLAAALEATRTGYPDFTDRYLAIND